jgi:hypothetical protein
MVKAKVWVGPWVDCFLWNSALGRRCAWLRALVPKGPGGCRLTEGRQTWVQGVEGAVIVGCEPICAALWGDDPNGPALAGTRAVGTKAVGPGPRGLGLGTGVVGLTCAWEQLSAGWGRRRRDGYVRVEPRRSACSVVSRALTPQVLSTSK